MLNFKNAKNLQRAHLAKSLDVYPYFKKIEESEATQITYRGKKLVMIGSNNYLGLTHHPYVKEKSIEAIKRFGTGCTGSRVLNGNLAIHEELEERLARFVGHEKALVFATGMQSNLGALSCLTGPHDAIFSDGENHASIIDGLRLSRSTTIKYRTNDMTNLEELLDYNRKNYQNAMIVTDGVFSMTGRLANLPKLAELSEKYKTALYVDDAHGLGVMGTHGSGTMNHFGLTNKVQVNMGTFSKSFASIGGFVSGSADMIDYLCHTSRSFIFSAALPPSACATVLACMDVVEKEPELLENLWKNVAFVKKGFEDLGFYTYSSQTPIIPILIGDDIKAMQVTKLLEEKGVFTTPVLSPAVPAAEALLRTSYMATHSRSELQHVLDVFADIAKTFPFPKTLQH